MTGASPSVNSRTGRRLAHVLAEAGIGPGDAVAISFTNRPSTSSPSTRLLVGAAPANLNYQYVAGSSPTLRDST